MVQNTDQAVLSCRQKESSQQRDALELELVALKKSIGSTSRQLPGRRGSQVMFGAVDGNSPASGAEARSDKLARELEEAEEQLAAMSAKMRHQV